MNLTDRITLSPEETVVRLERALDGFTKFQYDGKYKALLGEAVVNNIENWNKDIRARKKDPFTIVVAGEFKRGKSSFINALLEENILITNVNPETMTMNELRYGPHKNEAVLSGGRRLELSDDELSRSALERLMGELDEKIRRLILHRPIEILKNIRIIDTPGTNDLPEYFDDIVDDAMAQADAVIYVYNVEYPLSRSEQLYLKYSVLPQRYTKLFLIGNFGDTMADENELGVVKESIQERTKLLLPNEKAYLISALDELCRKTGRERPKPALEHKLEKEFDEFRSDLNELIEEKKTTVAADRMSRMARIMAEEISGDLDNIEKGMKMSEDQIIAEREKLTNEQNNQLSNLKEAQKSINNSIDIMKADAVKWVSMLMDKIERENLSEYAVQNILQYYFYYCADILQAGINECVEYHREELLEKMSAISDEMAKDLAGSYSNENPMLFSMRLESNTWTQGDSITLAINRFSGNSLISAISDLAGSLIRKNEMEADKDTLLNNIRTQYPTLRGDANKNIEIQYNSMCRLAFDLLDGFYRDKISKACDAVGQYEEVSKKSENDKVLITEAIKEIRAAVELLNKTYE